MFGKKEILEKLESIEQKIGAMNMYQVNELTDQIDEVNNTLNSFKKKGKKATTTTAPEAPVKKETPREYLVDSPKAKELLSKLKLSELRKALEEVPDGAQGFGGSTLTYNHQTKKMKLETFKSKSAAIRIIENAEEGLISIVM